MNNQIKELEKDLLKQVSSYVGVIQLRMRNDLNWLIIRETEPLLREVLEATKNSEPLEAKYTASDVLAILERLKESLPTID